MLTLICNSQISPERSKIIAYTTDTLQLDSLSILLGSLKVYCNEIAVDSTLYHYEWMNATFHFLLYPGCDSVNVVYNAIPFKLPRSHYHRYPQLSSENSLHFLEPARIQTTMDDTWLGSGIETNGSLSRGIQVGNAQNASVTSTLNLQISGKINDRFAVAGMVSDSNIPVQPGGDTRQVEDLDRVFIQLSDKSQRLTAGDFQLKRPAGYFMSYFKRAQGLLFQRGQEGGKTDYTEASASISKGRFARNLIQGIEGNQGPYRLSGSEGENFIIVLAGTEQVFIDGRLLQRGQDADYTIDYNAAEISFTPKQFITKDRRIVVEFQYSDKRYARPMFTASIFNGDEDNHVYLNVFSEHDAKNQPLQQELSDSDRILLSGAGDDPIGAARSGITIGGFEFNRVMYVLIDSLGFDSVLVYSADSSRARATAIFSLVGKTRGDYIEDGFTPFGKKYRWIAPNVVGTDTLHYGEYSPLYVLYPPSQQQMISGGFKHQLLPGFSLGVEGAVTHKDKNSFSRIDNSDDVGSAVRATMVYNNLTQEKKLSMTGEIVYEYVNRRFIMVERFREVEFVRDWNLPLSISSFDQHWLKIIPGIRIRDLGKVNIGADILQVEGLQLGKKYSCAADMSKKDKWTARGNASILKVNGNSPSIFVRHKTYLSKTLGEYSAVFNDEHEWNRKYSSDGDSLLKDAYRFYDWQGSLGTTDTLIRALRIHYRQRFEQRSDSLTTVPASYAEQYGLTSRIQWSEGNHLGINVSNRRLQIIRTDLLSTSPENTLVGRIDQALRIFKGGIVTSTFYEVGSGLEARRSFFYSEVAPGQGTHIWVDYNGNSIKELNEFEIAPFEYEANFIRVSVQNTEYVKTYSNTLNESIQLNFGRMLNPKTTWGRWLGKINNVSVYRQERKTASSDLQARMNPIFDWRADTSLLTVSGLVRNVFFYNRSSPVFGWDHTYQRTTRREILLGGFDQQNEVLQSVQMRYTFFGQLTLFVTASQKLKQQASDILPGRTYSLRIDQMEPRLLWQKDAEKSIELNGKYAEVKELSGASSGAIREVGTLMTLNVLDKSSFSASLNYAMIQYNGSANSPVGFEVLSGLSAGENFIWNITWQQSVAKNLQLNVSYQGRDSKTGNAVHVGNVQVRAVF